MFYDNVKILNSLFTEWHGNNPLYKFPILVFPSVFFIKKKKSKNDIPQVFFWLYFIPENGYKIYTYRTLKKQMA